MKLNPCPFCGASTRLGVVTKWLRVNEGCGAKRGAYARCKVCNARGSLVTIDGEYDIRNEYPTPLAKQALIEKAVAAWNNAGNAMIAKGVKGLPLFAKGGES